MASHYFPIEGQRLIFTLSDDISSLDNTKVNEILSKMQIYKQAFNPIALQENTFFFSYNHNPRKGSYN